MYKSQKGFAILETLLIVLILAIIGGTGYFVWHSRQETNKALDSAQKASDTPPKISKITNFDECAAAGNPIMETYPEQCRANGKTFTRDVTKDWKSFTSRSGKYSIKYPSTWSQATHPEACSDGLLLLGANKDSVGICGADGARAFGQIAISESTDRVSLDTCGLSSTYWRTDSTETTKVAGYTAKKISATYIANDESEGGQAKGNKTVQYCFVAKGTLYIASYVQWADQPDALGDFNTMVTHTFIVK